VDTKQMLGTRIKNIRNKKGLTQEQLSEKMEINPKYLSSIERGNENPTLNTLIKLSESLEVDSGEIFTHLQIEDPGERKFMITSLLDQADDEQLKLIFKVLSAILH
jgi:transcriptional regulator with XRE-family HTH domain